MEKGGPIQGCKKGEELLGKGWGGGERSEFGSCQLGGK